MDINKVKTRWGACWDAKQDELDRIEKGYLWLYEFEKHLRDGEVGHDAYRFPETMGYVVRRYNEYLKVLPESRVKGNKDGSIGLQAAIDSFEVKSNIKAIKMAAIADAAAFGNGLMYVTPHIWRRKLSDGTEKVEYAGLAAEKVDWRHFFPAPGYKMLHDHTGLNSCPYAFRERKYHIDTFREVGKVKGWKNVDKVIPTVWENSNVWGATDWAAPHETEEYSSAVEFVTVLEYWDVVNDVYSGYVTGGWELFNEPKGIPLSHKKLPFHHYRNTYRLDSINAIGEIEINMPYNLFREKVMNLSIDDIMLQIQKPMVVDGDINFNSEEQELEAGAIFNVRGLSGGKLQDHIMPLQLGGGVSDSVMSVIQMIENSRISVTSDDTTALYSNPNQLATQTLAKMQSLNKSIDAATKRNIYDTEFYLTKQIASYIKNEFTESYKDGKKTKFYKVDVDGYDVVQDDDMSVAKFEKGYGASGKFVLNGKMAEEFDDDDIEVIPAQVDEELKRDQTEKLMLFMQTLLQTIGSLAQSQPDVIPQVLGDMDIPEFMKITIKNLGLDDEVKNIFPIIAKAEHQLDAINAEHDQIMMGITPELREDEESLEEYAKHLKFKNSAFFKNNASKEAKNAMNKHLSNTLQNAQVQNSVPVASRQGGLAQPQGGSVNSGVQGANRLVGSSSTSGGTPASLQTTKGEMERGLLSGPTQLG